AIFFFAAAPTFAHRAAKTDYTDLNSAYRFSANLFQTFEAIVKNFGLFYFSLFVLGAAWAIIDTRTRRFAIFLLIQWLITFALFGRTQDFEYHHLYLLLPAIL